MCVRSRASQPSQALPGKPFRHYPFDPVAAENFQQKLSIPVASGPFGVLKVIVPLKIRATTASFPLLPGPASQAASLFLLHQTEHAGRACQNPILRIERGARYTASLDNALTESTIILWHGLHTPAKMDGHPSSTIVPATERRNITQPSRTASTRSHNSQPQLAA